MPYDIRAAIVDSNFWTQFTSIDKALSSLKQMMEVSRDNTNMLAEGVGYESFCKLQYEIDSENRQALRNFDRRVLEKYPASGIVLSWEEKGQRVESLYLFEEELEKELDAWSELEYGYYCSGYGDPELTSYKIEIRYPNGKTKKVDRYHGLSN